MREERQARAQQMQRHLTTQWCWASRSSSRSLVLVGASSAVFPKSRHEDAFRAFPRALDVARLISGHGDCSLGLRGSWNPGKVAGRCFCARLVGAPLRPASALSPAQRLVRVCG